MKRNYKKKNSFISMKFYKMQNQSVVIFYNLLMHNKLIQLFNFFTKNMMQM